MNDKDKLRNYVNNLKKQSGCMRCGYNSYVGALDFNHLNPLEKVADISQMLTNSRYTRDEILAEIAKCEILCATCHREIPITRLRRPKSNSKSRIKIEYIDKQYQSLLTDGERIMALIVIGPSGGIREINIKDFGKNPSWGSNDFFP